MAPEWLDEANSEWDADDDWNGPDAEGLDDQVDDPADETTVPCPACGADIYDDAVRCPVCGEYITLNDSSVATPFGWSRGIVAILVVAVIAAMLVSMTLL